MEMIHRGIVILRLSCSDTFSNAVPRSYVYSSSIYILSSVLVILVYKFRALKLCRVSDDCSW